MKFVLKTLSVAALAALLPSSVFACAACYGANVDSAMTTGMNWGIFTLLGVLVPVLAGFLFFLIRFIRKSEAMETAQKSAAVNAGRGGEIEFPVHAAARAAATEN